MVDVITGIDAAIKTAKKLIEVNEAIENADVKMLIAELSVQLAEAKISIAELLDKNRGLQDEIESLKKKQDEELNFIDGVYFDNNGDGPFCPGCYDGKKQKHRLILVSASQHRKMGVHRCSVCNKFFTYEGGKP